MAAKCADPVEEILGETCPVVVVEYERDAEFDAAKDSQ
jgi:hypothetical protein